MRQSSGEVTKVNLKSGNKDRNRYATGQQRRWPIIQANKSKLYTLNPFAIGVKYLRPKKRNVGTASKDDSDMPTSS